MSDIHPVTKNNSISIWRRIKNKLQYGLMLQVIRNQLAKIGIEITPYYWEKEEAILNTPPAIKGNFSEYKPEFLGPDDMKYIGNNARGYPEEKLCENLEKGKKCIGLKHNNEVIAFMWIDFEECNFRPNKMMLKSNEVYLFNMYTMESFRGMNIAPNLRYHCYQILKKMGINTFYSVSEFFNSSALKYKKKLGIKHQKLILYIGLFKKVHLSFTLKTYMN